jgi:hypothetical protein
MFVDSRSITPKVRAQKTWHVAKRSGHRGTILLDGCNYRNHEDHDLVPENKRKYLTRMEDRGFHVVGFRDNDGSHTVIMKKERADYYGDYASNGNISNTDVKTDYLYNRMIPPTKFLRPCKGGWTQIQRKGKVGRVHQKHKSYKSYQSYQSCDSWISPNP